MSKAAIVENKIDDTKNSAANLNYYDELTQFFDGDTATTLLKLRSFGIYAPRQVVTDFLVRYELFKMIVDIPGSIFELGVFNGQGLFSYAHFSTIIEPNHINRRIYGFDTFEGFAGVAPADKTSRSQFMTDGDYSVDSFDRLQTAISIYDKNRPIGHLPKIELVRGDVCVTLADFIKANPHVMPALVHLDMDIFKPTKLALELLLPRMPKGGVVVFDEINMKDFPGETVAFYDVLKANDVALRRVPFCSRISYFVV